MTVLLGPARTLRRRRSEARPPPPGSASGADATDCVRPIVYLRLRHPKEPGIEYQRYTPFALSAAQRDAEATLVVVGELDLESADELTHGVWKLRLPEITEIVLDLRRVDFIDSSGLRALLALHDDAAGNGHALKLIPPPPSARRVFEITGTWDLFEWA